MFYKVWGLLWKRLGEAGRYPSLCPQSWQLGFVILPSEGRVWILVSSARTAFISCFGPIACGRNDSDPVLILALRKLLLFFLWNPAIPIWTVWVCLLDNEWETWAQLLCPFGQLPANCLEYRGQLTYIMLRTQKASAVRWEVPPSVSRLSYQLADCAWNKWLFF